MIVAALPVRARHRARNFGQSVSWSIEPTPEEQGNASQTGRTIAGNCRVAPQARLGDLPGRIGRNRPGRGVLGLPLARSGAADLDALRAQAEQDLLAGRYDRVAAAIERLSRQRRPSPLDYLLRAQYAAARQQPDAALADLERVPDDHACRSKARLLAGQIELRRDRVRRAEEWFQEALRLDSRLVQAHRELIYIYGMQLRRAELSAQFLALSQLTPLTSDNVFHWCLLRNNSWEPGEAVATLDRYVSADPADRWSRIALAENYRRMGQADSAESVLEPLALDDSEALVIRAQIAVDRQEQDRAERLLASGKKTTPNWPGCAAGWRSRNATLHRPCINSASHSRPTPTIAKPSSGWRAALELAHETKAAEPFRELARNLERLNTLVHRAANRTARRTRPCCASSGMRARPCTGGPKPVPGTSWRSRATRSTRRRSGPCFACASRSIDRSDSAIDAGTRLELILMLTGRVAESSPGQAAIKVGMIDKEGRLTPHEGTSFRRCGESGCSRSAVAFSSR